MSQPVVLNTRPRAQAAELTGLLEAAGFRSLEAPAIEVVPAWDPTELESVVRDLHAHAYAWLVLPGQNAAAQIDRQLFPTRVVCGTATARALGIQAHIALERFSAAGAVEALRAYVQPGDRMLVPRAAEGRDELVEGLTAMGARVDDPIAYRTVAVSPSELGQAVALVRTGGVDAITVCSPSAMLALLQVLSPSDLASSLTVCLGQTTAETARLAGVSVDAVAERTSMRSLVRAVQAALHVPRVPV